jgi:ATP-binding cassette, subfamily B, bacterial
MASFPVFIQHDAMDCGPTCLRMVAKYYGRNYSLQFLREQSYITREGVSLLGISDAAESIGMRTLGISVNYEQLSKEVPLPAIVHWKQNHFIVVYKITKKAVYVADPAYGLLKLSIEEFKKGWISDFTTADRKGLALVLQPTPEFYNKTGEKLNRSSFRFLYQYIKPYKRYISQLLLGVFLASILQLIFPFLTQAIVDYGINNQDIGFIYLILISQLVIVISRQSIDFIRGWILLHLTARINISLISDFLIKLMKLPLSFFDTKLTGDLLQRIGDHRRIEVFLTSSSLSIVLALFNVVIFSIVLAVYSIPILLIFLSGASLYILWLTIFMKKRRDLDFKRFGRQSEQQGKLIQLIHGIEEIKLNDAERSKRWEWEQVQAALFHLNIRSLSLNQYQQAGAVFINEVKNIVITFIAATSVVNGTMTLGMMLAVSYILGQLNGPLEQMTVFLRSAQDARISLERLSEIHEKENESANLVGKVTAHSTEREY